MTPLTRRRLASFRRNRRGFWSLWIFLGLFVVAFCAELVANDRPILLWVDGRLYVPALVAYREDELGGELPISADFRDPWLAESLQGRIETNGGFMVWPLIRFSHQTIDWALLVAAPAPPGTAGHVLGTDGLGRDLAAMLIYAFRLSVLFGLALTLVSATIGVTFGAIQGYFGGAIDLFGQRFQEIWAGMPVLFLLITLTSIVEPTVFWLLLVLSLFSWMPLVGVVRAEFLRARNFDFVRAARSLGVPDPTIMRRHVLPNAMVAALTYFPFLLTGAITSLTALDFLGFGLPIDAPSMGRLLSQAKSNLQAPWIGLSVFCTLAVMLTLLIFIGEAVRDAFDPRRSVT